MYVTKASPEPRSFLLTMFCGNFCLFEDRRPVTSMDLSKTKIKVDFISAGDTSADHTSTIANSNRSVTSVQEILSVIHNRNELRKFF